MAAFRKSLKISIDIVGMKAKVNLHVQYGSKNPDKLKDTYQSCGNYVGLFALIFGLGTKRKVGRKKIQ
jgi:hypothetical protein